MSPTLVDKMDKLEMSDNEEEEIVPKPGEKGTISVEKKTRRNRRSPPEFTAVVMAAGYGSRLFELRSDNTPKCLVPVGNVPLIWYPVNMLLKNSFEEVTIVTRQSDRQKVERFLTKAFSAHNITFDFFTIDDDSVYGTADSLRDLTPHLKSEVLVVSCDVITTAPLLPLVNLHRARSAAITCLVSERYHPNGPEVKKKLNKNDERDFVGVTPHDDRLVFVCNEKDVDEELCLYRGQLSKFPHMRLYSNLVDAHVYAVSRDALEHLTEHASVSMIRGELLPLLVKKQVKALSGKESAYSDRLYEARVTEDDADSIIYEILLEEKKYGCYISRTEDFCVRLNSIHNYILYNKVVMERLGSILPAVDMSTYKIDKMTQVGKDSRIGEHVTIGGKCSIKRSCVGSHCNIGPHCKITDCVILDNVTIEDNVILSNSVIGSRATLRSHVTLKECRVASGCSVGEGVSCSKEVLDQHEGLCMGQEDESESDSDDSFQSK